MNLELKDPEIKCCDCDKDLPRAKTAWNYLYKELAKGREFRCSSCSQRKSFKDNPNRGKNLSQKAKGRKLTENAKKEIKQKNKIFWSDPENLYKHSQMIRDRFKLRPMKSVQDIWIEKYGIEEAERREKIRAEKHSKAISGRLNKSFGKSPSKYAGAGWKGYYKGVFFRSLLELRYLYFDCPCGALPVPVSAETKEYGVEYVDEDGKERTYRPDFVDDEGRIIELKPESLLERNLLKFMAASKKFNTVDRTRYFVFTDRTLPVLDWENFEQLVKDKAVVLTEWTKKRIRAKHLARFQDKSLFQVDNYSSPDSLSLASTVSIGSPSA